jgi:hypothetical protein
MRRLIIKLALFFGIMEGLGHVSLMVVLSASALALAIVICSDLLLDSAR